MRRTILKTLLVTLLAAAPLGAAEAPKTTTFPAASAQELPRWRGFNILNRFHVDWSNRPFEADDFKWIAEWGFNFVRFPMDYRTWILDKDWNKVNEEELKKIDQAVAWANQYGLHVCLNFHRAPGFTVNSPKEAKDLWTDAEAQEACVKHWTMFAKRYKGIPSSKLSFNLFNEPGGADGATLAKVSLKVAKAIWAIDPQRLIICDGMGYGKDPHQELVGQGVAQATRGYGPFGLTHYKANWVDGSAGWAIPQWPVIRFNSYLYGTDKKDLMGPLVLEGALAKKSELRIHVNTVSRLANLAITADGKVVLSKKLEPKDGTGEWKTSVYKPEWKIYQNVYDRDYSAILPAGTRRVEISAGEGDWLTFDRIEIVAVDGSSTALLRPNGADWGVKQGVLTCDAQGNLTGGTGSMDRKALWEKDILPWKALQAKGVGVMVGEWGSYNKTPHDVVMRWMKDCLENYKEAGWGWALWNFRGDFGVMDSGRTDVEYEDFNGHKLDRKMLELLQAY